METGTSQPQRPPEQPYRRRTLPLRITILLVLVLITTVLNAVRFFTAIAWGSALQNYLPATQVAYVAITGGIWTLAGVFVLWWFIRGGRYAGLFILLAGAAYALWFWADRIFVQVGPNADWRFDLVVTVVLLVYVGAVVLDPHNRDYFRRERHER